jgi:TolB-like protein
MNDINLEILAEIRKLRRLTLWAILTLLVFASALGAASWLVAHWNAPGEANARHHVPLLTSPAIPGVLDKSIAVLPFLDLSDNQRMAYFAEDVREDILLELAKVDDLKVVSSSNAAYLLEGSVRRVGNRVRLHVKLINTGRDKTIWTETYDRDLPMDSL